jgi:hypothetical protein
MNRTVRFIFVNFEKFHPNFQDLPAYFRENGEVAEFHGAMTAQPGGGWARNLAERLMSAGQTRGRRAGVENVWRSRNAYPRHYLRLEYVLMLHVDIRARTRAHAYHLTRDKG